MPTTVSIDVSYSQLAVFETSLEHPFNDWTDQHIAQGFTWRPGSVSFRSVVAAGKHVIEIGVVAQMPALDAQAMRVIDVPFVVPADGALEVGSIADTAALSLPAGSYQLRCAFLAPDGSDQERVRLAFAKSDSPQFNVVLADAELTPGQTLSTTAQPAV